MLVLFVKYYVLSNYYCQNFSEEKMYEWVKESMFEGYFKFSCEVGYFLFLLNYIINNLLKQEKVNIF